MIIHLNKALKKTGINEDVINDLIYLDIDDLRQFHTLDGLFSFMRQLIEKILSFINRNSNDEDQRIINKVKSFCEKNYYEDISLDSISKYISMGKNYFCAYFKKKAGESFWDYLTNLRVDKAKVFLETTEIKVNIIVEKVGYKNASHFGRVFKEVVGITPAEYKEQVHKYKIYFDSQ